MLAVRCLPRKKVVYLVIILLIGFSTCQAAQEDKKLESIRGEIRELSQSLEQDQDYYNNLQSELAKQEKLLGKIGRELHRLDAEIVAQDEHLHRLKENKQRQIEALATTRYQLKLLVRSAYALGRQERIKLFLNQQDPQVLSRIMNYYNYFNQQRIEQIEAANRLIQDISDTEQKIHQTRLTLESNRQLKKKQAKEFESARQNRSRLVAELENSIKGKKQALSGLQQDEAALTKLLKNIQQQKLEQKRKFSSLKGNMAWPAKGYLSNLFGSQKAEGVKWDGVFITAGEGTEIKSIHQGKVAYADWLRGYGLLIIVDHGEGYMSLYGHNQSLFKETGDPVETGEAIALVGNSGGQNKSGLYFSIRQKGKPTNPKKWCVKTNGRKL
jgi:septal ring factor EnvC (AmiA/AmiB activator)